LIKAVTRFKLSKECRFSTYGTWWIRQSIERAIVNQSRTIRLPVHVTDDINKMLRVNRGLVRKMNREPSVKEVSAEMEVNIPYVRRLMVLLKRTYSIDQPMGENSDYFLSDTIEDTSAVSPDEFSDNLNSYEMISMWFDTLTSSEQKILTLRFGLDDKEPQTLETIGHSFGVTRERIRQIEAKSLEKLRKLVEATQTDLIDKESC
jgi:RNA polymerase primary sigma factor